MSKLFNRSTSLNKIMRHYLFTSSLRTCSQQNVPARSPDDAKDYDILSYVDLSNEFKVGIRSATRKLEQLFGMKKRQITNVLAENRFLVEVPGKIMSDNHKLCQEYGISNETMISYLYLLSERHLHEKLHMLQKLNFDMNELIPLMKLNVLALNKIIQNKDLAERIAFFSSLLKVSKLVICECIIKRPFLLYINMEKAETICQLLYETGTTNEEILKDMWVLRYSSFIVKERIDYIKSQNVEKFKTWMIRGDKDIIDNYIQRKSENKSILGNHSLIEYLSEKLECSPEHAKALIIKCPAFENKRLKKVQEILEFLHQKGISSSEIIRCPKILFFHMDTIKKRFQQVNEMNVPPFGLHVYMKSQKQFNEYYDTLMKGKKKENKKQLTEK